MWISIFITNATGDIHAGIYLSEKQAMKSLAKLIHGTENQEIPEKFQKHLAEKNYKKAIKAFRKWNEEADVYNYAIQEIELEEKMTQVHKEW
jgi:hypothetical protein